MYISPQAHKSQITGTEDYYLIKFDSNLTPIWATYFGGPGAESDFLLQNLRKFDNELYFTGYSDNVGFINPAKTGMPDYFMAKFTTDGNFISALDLNISQRSISINIEPITKNSFYLTLGTSYGANMATPNALQQNLISNPAFQNLSSNFSPFISFYSPISYLSTPSFSENELLAYPNPTNGIIHLSNPENISNISLYNNLGQVVFIQNNITNTININHLSAGHYILSVKYDNYQIKNYKVIKQ